MTNKPYRKNVGIVVFNSQGQAIVGERVEFPGSWQFPQGGIDNGEEYVAAAERELYEEIGVKDATYVGEYKDWLDYDFPNFLNLHAELQKFRGQTQKWILYYWNHPIEDCTLDHFEREFLSVKYMDLLEIPKVVVDFKKPAYEKFVPFFFTLAQNYIADLKK